MSRFERLRRLKKPPMTDAQEINAAVSIQAEGYDVETEDVVSEIPGDELEELDLEAYELEDLSNPEGVVDFSMPPEGETNQDPPVVWETGAPPEKVEASADDAESYILGSLLPDIIGVYVSLPDKAASTEGKTPNWLLTGLVASGHLCSAMVVEKATEPVHAALLSFMAPVLPAFLKLHASIAKSDAEATQIHSGLETAQAVEFMDAYAKSRADDIAAASVDIPSVPEELKTHVQAVLSGFSRNRDAIIKAAVKDTEAFTAYTWGKPAKRPEEPEFPFRQASLSRG